MTTVTPNQPANFRINAGDALKLTAAENTIGLAWWLGSGQVQDALATRVVGGDVIVLGPYLSTALLKVECTAGAVDVEAYGVSAPVPVSFADAVAPALVDKLDATEMVDTAELLGSLIEAPEGAAEEAVNAIINALTRNETPPSIDASEPAHEADDVDSETLEEITITFDGPVKFAAEPSFSLIIPATGEVVNHWNRDDILTGKMYLDNDNVDNDWLRLVLKTPLAYETEYELISPLGSLLSFKYGKPVPTPGNSEIALTFETVAEA